MNILFVCKGNLIRSQMAEAIFNKLSAQNHFSFSAGVKIPDRLNGEKLQNNIAAIGAIIVLREIGVNIADKIRKQLTEDMFDKADKVIFMAEPNLAPTLFSKCDKIIHWSIADPKGQSLDHFRFIRNQIQTLVSELVTDLELKNF